MSEKTLNSRMIQKHDIEANWLKATNFTPLQGELIVYDVDENYNYERIKMGDGVTNVNKLPFISPQADWNQNDENAPDYVKNRTHWEEGIILPETKLVAVEEGLAILTAPNTMPEEGKIYTVVYNGAPYDCPCVRYGFDDAEPDYWMGRTSELDAELDSNSDAPFLLGFKIAPTATEIGTVYGAMIDMNGATSGTVSVVEQDAVVHKIAPRFLPDTVVMAERPVTGNNYTVILPETELTHAGGDDPQYTLTVQPSAIPAAGTSVNVTYNGVVYTCPVVYQKDGEYDVYAMGNLEILGETGGNSDAPFAVMLVPAGVDGMYGICTVIDAPEGVTLSIVQETAFVPKQLVMDENGNIKWEDRTHWIEGGLVDVLSTATYGDEDSLMAACFTPMSASLVADKVYQVNWNGTMYECTAVAVTEDGLTMIALGNTDAAGITGGNTNAPFVIVEYPPEMAGVDVPYWYPMSVDANGVPDSLNYPCTIGIQYFGEVVHKIDNKYLNIAQPDWSAAPGANGYIANKTHYHYENLTIALDPEKCISRDTFTYNNLVFAKVSELYLDAAIMRASTLYKIDSLTGEKTLVPSSSPSIRDNAGSSILYIDNCLVISVHDTTVANALYGGIRIPSVGTYVTLASTEATYELEIGEILKKLDAKFLPEIEEVNSNIVNGSSRGSLRMIDSVAEDDTYALGVDAIALNKDTRATGAYSFASGQSTGAFGDCSHSEGYTTYAQGDYSHSEGNFTRAYGDYSHAEGRYSFAKGEYSHAEGYAGDFSVTISGEANAVEYKVDTFTGVDIGRFIFFNGKVAQIIGVGYSNGETTIILSETLSSSPVSNQHANIKTTASGIASHVEGYRTMANGDFSHAEGACTAANGEYSHAEGNYTIANGNHSHAQGDHTIARGYAETALGKYNLNKDYQYAVTADSPSVEQSYVNTESYKVMSSVPKANLDYGYWTYDDFVLTLGADLKVGDCIPGDQSGQYFQITELAQETDTERTFVCTQHSIINCSEMAGTYAVMLGNGNSTARSNAHAIGWNGNAYYTGDVYVQGDGKTIGFDGKKKLATEEYVNAQITAIDYPVDSVNGKTGNVTLTASDVGADASGSAAAALTESKEYADNQIDSAIDALPQTDWSQNDPEAADYVKNRTHYEDIEYILSETTVALKPVYGAMGSLPFASVPVNGNTYDVTYNGKSYSVVAKVTYGCVFETSDFMIMYMGNNVGQIQTFDGSATATISISGDVNGAYSELLAETTISLQATGISAGTITEPFNGELAGDVTYTVSCNGTLYSVRWMANPMVSYLSDADSIIYISVPTDGALSRFQIQGDVAEATISIYWSNIQQLDVKYLPNINANLVNGSAAGSLRTIGSAEESDDYTMGKNAFAEGKNTTASGDGSHAEGYGTIASGHDSHAEGANTMARGAYSHAEGYNTAAQWDYAHAEGLGTAANGKSQHVAGEYNIINTAPATQMRATYAHIVGNGESNTARSNAHTLDWDGNAWFAGNVYIGGTGQDDTAAVKLITQAEMEAYVNESILGGAW